MKTLVTIIEGGVVLLGLAIICSRCSEVAGSDEGLWPAPEAIGAGRMTNETM